MTWHWVIWIFLPPLVHELGHWGTARMLGYKIKFYREGFRFCWDSPPYRHEWHDILVNQMGFGLEFLGIFAACHFGGFLLYTATAVGHFLAYPWYAGRKTDFDSIVKNGKIGR